MKARLFFFTLCILISFSRSVYAQTKEVKFLIDSTITILKNDAVNARKVNWKKITRAVYSKVEGINDPYKLGPAMRFLLQSLNDFHGAFYYRDSIFKWVPKELPVSDSMKNEWSRGVKSITSVLNGNIGYLRVPSMPFGGRADSDQKAQGLNDSLCSLLNKQVKAIILDLRLNGGGAMYPMILGLKQLLEPGKVGAFIGNSPMNWYMENNQFRLDTTVMASIIPKCNINAVQIPVVILTSPITGSSAEFLIMTFKPRKKTILLGSKTAGYVTTIKGLNIGKSSHLNYSAGYGVDKNGNSYLKAINPDIAVEGIDSFNDIPNDVKVKEAMNWLRSQL